MPINPPPSNLPIAKDPDMPKVKPDLPPTTNPLTNQPPVARPAPSIPSVLPSRPQQPSPVPAPKAPADVKSFIRTMEGDIKSLKQGVTPKSVEVMLPKPSALPPLPQTQTGTPAPTAKPVIPTPTIRIGEAEKSRVLPGIRPAVPSKTEQSKAIVIPPKKAGFLSKSLIITIAVILLVGGGAYWFFVVKQGTEPVATTTFTPRPTLVPDPLKPLKTLFSLSNQASLPDSASLTDLASVRSAVFAAVTDDQIKNVFIVPKSETDKSISFSEFTKRFLANQAVSGSGSETLASSIYDENFGLISSLQEEKFDSKGKPVPDAPVERRLALVVEVSGFSGAQNALNTWEANLPLDIRDLFELGSQTSSQTFQDNSYREVPIRFVNFPNPDRSIDYAFITSVNGKQYLVIASSRAQMFSVIDTLLGF